MGFRFRKSFGNKFFRVTVSKSGIGCSAGVKGARITKTAKGRTRTSVGVPGTGIGYVKETGGKKRRNFAPNNSTSSNYNTSDQNTSKVRKPLIKTKKQKIAQWISIGLMASAILTLAADFFAWTALAGLILFFVNRAAVKRNPENQEDNE